MRRIERSERIAETLRKSEGHKYDHGHLLVLTGGFGRTGAARLAARAAQRIGAGLVTLAAPGAALMECAAQTTSAMLRRCADADGLRVTLKDPRLNALVAGPGFGLEEREAMVIEALLDSGRSCVLDADALTLVSRDRNLRDRVHEGCVLTPHMGEFARLFPGVDHDDRGASARRAAERLGCTLVLKGPRTIVARPDGSAAVHIAEGERSVPWLATAGAGDVLAGMIGGLLARGVAPGDVAEAAVWAHVEAALAFGPGLIAEDLPEMLPVVLRGLDRGAE